MGRSAAPFRGKMVPRAPWASYTDGQLLQMRFKDIKVKLEGTWLEGRLHALYDELERRGLRFRPHSWISDEWFSPDTTPGIAIPFYLTHPRLMRLERAKIGTVEGGPLAECMRILRHEAGHTLRTAYQLHRRRRWQAVFGLTSQRYPKYYRPNPTSKHYVQHLRLWYAQSHPDEDFAETFAVWLKPRSDWRKRYADWPAIEKLEYVDELMAELSGARPVVTKRLRVDPLSSLSQTLAAHYKKKQALYRVEGARAYDKDLRRIFSADPRHGSAMAASTFIRANHARLRALLPERIGEYPMMLDWILDEMVRRCRNLDLRAVGSKRRLLDDFTALLAAQTMRSLYYPSPKQTFAL